jgi:hypothetical protein
MPYSCFPIPSPQNPGRWFYIRTDFLALVHQQSSAEHTRCKARGSICHIVVLTGLLLLLLLLAVALLLLTIATRELPGAFTSLLVDIDPALALPLGAPWIWGLWWAAALLLLLVLVVVVAEHFGGCGVLCMCRKESSIEVVKGRGASREGEEVVDEDAAVGEGQFK